MAYCLSPGASLATTAARERVESWYRDFSTVESSNHHNLQGESVGLAAWWNSETTCSWPAFWRDGSRAVATINAPVGFDALTALPAASAPWAVTQQLIDKPSSIFELSPPFTFARIDVNRDEITVITDALGVGRMFSLTTAAGTFWSNRPLAALLFAGVPVSASVPGWQSISAIDWPSGDLSPYEGVAAVGAATQVSGRAGVVRTQTVDTLDWLVNASASADAMQSAASELARIATSVAKLWTGEPTINLSGGKDSRLVAASFVAAGVPVQFQTVAGIDGEVTTATDLLRRVGQSEAHTITDPHQGGALSHEAILTRGVAWHAVVEGLCPVNALANRAPTHLINRPRPLISGAGGDYAHGFYLPTDVAKIEEHSEDRQRQAWINQLRARLLLPRGISDAANKAAVQYVGNTLDVLADRGIHDSRALTWMYLHERVRRWGHAGDGTGRVLPLLNPRFAAASFSLSGQQLRDHVLHSQVISELVPQWQSVPFFSATLAQRTSTPATHRIAEAPDRDMITTALLDEGSGYAAEFDLPMLTRVWASGIAGQQGPRDEQLFQRFVWRVTFDDHLRQVRGEDPIRRQPTSAKRLPKPSRNVPLAKKLATKANDWAFAKRIARTQFGRSIRRRIGA